MFRSMSAIVVRAFGASDRGLVRQTNEDAFVMADLSSGQRWAGGRSAEWKTSPKGVLLAVSDGMGGAKAGEVASALSVEGVLAGLLQVAKDGRPDGEALRQVIERANERVHDAARRPDRRGMGATLTAVLVSGTTAFLAQIGDSRAYLIRGNEIRQCTHDQSYVQMLVDAGVLTAEQASHSPRKNIILQVMGQEALRVALGRLELRRGDRLLVCTDGLTNVVDDEAIVSVAAAPTHLGPACAELVQRTRAGGAPDNVTVLLAETV
jgi:PPM family protein phosphatase